MMPLPASRQLAAAHRAGQGFTLFELAVTVAVIGILMVVLLSRLSFYRDTAERLAFEQTVTALRAQVRLQSYGLLIARRPQEIPLLVGNNPMNWLAQKPANYLGEYYSPDTKNFASGNWFFDRSNGKLVYLLNKSNSLEIWGSELLQFKVSLAQASVAANDAASTVELLPLQESRKVAVGPH